MITGWKWRPGMVFWFKAVHYAAWDSKEGKWSHILEWKPKTTKKKIHVWRKETKLDDGFDYNRKTLVGTALEFKPFLVAFLCYISLINMHWTAYLWKVYPCFTPGETDQKLPAFKKAEIKKKLNLDSVKPAKLERSPGTMAAPNKYGSGRICADSGRMDGITVFDSIHVTRTGECIDSLCDV